MKIIGMDGYRIYVEIEREDYPKLVKAFANLDDDNTKEN